MGAVYPKSEYHETSDISALIPGEMTNKIKQYCSFPSFIPFLIPGEMHWEKKKKKSQKQAKVASHVQTDTSGHKCCICRKNLSQRTMPRKVLMPETERLWQRNGMGP